MTAYPAGMPVITSGSTHGDVADEIEALAASLGAGVQGTKATVAERLRAFGWANMPGGQAGDFLRPATPLATQVQNANFTIVAAIPVGAAFTADGFQFRVTTGQAGSTFTPVLYGTADDGLPGDLLVVGPETSTATAGTQIVACTPILIPSGVVWAGGVTRTTGSTPTLNTLGHTSPGPFPGYYSQPMNALINSGYHGGSGIVLPDTMPRPLIDVRFIPAVWVRAA